MLEHQPNPTVADSKTTDGSGTGSYTSDITGLTAGTPYYVRAYSTNGAGTAYGSEKSLPTAEAVRVIVFNPDLAYGTVSDIDGSRLSRRFRSELKPGWLEPENNEKKCSDGTQFPQKTFDDDAWDKYHSSRLIAGITTMHQHQKLYTVLYITLVCGTNRASYVPPVRMYLTIMNYSICHLFWEA